jgi:aspartate aminotransferase/aminotransferase
MKPSRRLSSLQESGIRKFFSLAAGRKDLVNLSIGVPDFPTPPEVADAACQAIRAGKNQYTPTTGIPELRAAIAGLLKKKGVAARPEEIIVTNGTTGALALTLGGLLDPGDEVILPDPVFPLYRELLGFLGAEVKTLDTRPDFRLTAAKLAPLLSERTKLVVLLSPGNPTGVVPSRAELEELAELLKKKGTAVLADEVWEKVVFNGGGHTSFASLLPEQTLTANAFSKSHAVTGWRVGWLHAPGALAAELAKLQQFLFVCAPTPFQNAFAEVPEISIEKEVAELQKKRDFLAGKLKEAGFEFPLPEGGIFLCPRASEGFAERAITAGVAVVPGSAFSQWNDFFRVSFSAPWEALEKGAEILAGLK